MLIHSPNFFRIQNDHPVFFSGKESTDIANHSPKVNKVIYSALTNCRVIDDIGDDFCGAIGTDAEEHTVFIKIPRKKAIASEQTKGTHIVVKSMESFIAKDPSRSRGKQRTWQGDTYTFNGITACQGISGLPPLNIWGNRMTLPIMRCTESRELLKPICRLMMLMDFDVRNGTWII